MWIKRYKGLWQYLVNEMKPMKIVFFTDYVSKDKNVWQCTVLVGGGGPGGQELAYIATGNVNCYHFPEGTFGPSFQNYKDAHPLT